MSRTLTLVEHRRTAFAVLLSADGHERRAAWVALELITLAETGRTAVVTRRDGLTDLAGIVEVTLPLWLARQKGFCSVAGDGQGRLL